MRRTNQFKVLMSDEELESLRALAAGAGLTASDYIRQAIRSEAERLGIDKGKKR